MGIRAISGINDLSTVNSKLADEWHPTKNASLTPEQVTGGSTKKVWWLGKCGHEFEMIIGNRHRKGYGCPYCSNQKLLSGFNDLNAKFPELVLEWHPTKNGTLQPHQVMPGSHQKVWWLGKCGHEWETSIYVRTGKGKAGCPICAGQKVISGFNDFESKFPELSMEWHPTKNGILKPSQVTSKSGQKVWWVCKCGHEWKAEIKSRADGRGCPYCSHRRLLSGFNDLESMNPYIAAEWHPTKNGELLPSQCLPCSSKKVWWVCPLGHEYQATIANRAWGKNCSVCSAETKTSFPEQAILYYLRQVTNAKNRYIVHGKEIDIWLPDINSGIEYNGSYWHKNKESKDREKIEYFKLYDIRILSVADANFNELGNDSVFYTYDPYKRESLNWAIKAIFSMLKLPAPVIDVKKDEAKIRTQYVIEEKNTSLAIQYPEISAEWHPVRNGELRPTQVKAHSGQKVWWLGKCNHEWEQQISKRTGLGRGCPYCSGQKVLPGFNDLSTVAPDLAREWHPTQNGELSPSLVGKGYTKKVWWHCKLGHDWEATVNARFSHSTGCPYCSGRKKTE